MTTKVIFQVSKVGFPIRKSPDQSLFATPRGLSQRITSFIACACQGIHRTPLRHLIVLIANTHLELEWAWQKDQLLETYSKVAVRQTYHVQRLSGLTAANWILQNPNTSSLHNFIQNRQCTRSALQTYSSLRMTDKPTLVEPDGIEPTTSCLQSRRSPS
jgi:hypothetical protein